VGPQQGVGVGQVVAYQGSSLAVT
ncbi:uncharacterized protein METZ01_LOCUS99017, partial [marine metagenome]